MKRRAVAFAAILALGVVGCASEPDLAACERAMREGFEANLESDQPATEERPAECEGVSDEDLGEIAGRIIEDALEDEDLWGAP